MRRIDAQVALSAVKATGAQIDFTSLGLALDMKSGDLTVTGKLATPLSLNLDTGQAGLTKLAGDFSVGGPSIPNKSMQLAVGGNAHANWVRKSARADLTARFDESNARIGLDIADFARLAPRFDVVVDKLDVDRYTGRAAAPTQGAAGKAPQAAAAAKEKPIDLSALKGVDASGRVRVGSLAAAKLKVQELDVQMKAGKGLLELSPISARLYQGSARGSATVDANGHRFVLRQQLSNVAIGSLLRDVAQKDVLEGRGAVTVDVTTSGNVVSALKRGLNGKASIQLRDGAIKGFDLAAIARQVRSLRSGKLENSATAKVQKTDFTELTASFAVKNGVAHNDDLALKSPFVRVGGAGDIDVSKGTLDYVLKASIVATSAGQEGRALADLRGLTFPVRLTGPFEDIKYSVDAGALAAEIAKSELTRRLEERVPTGPAGDVLKGPLGDALKGLLRR
jgi:AsmA protein